MMRQNEFKKDASRRDDTDPNEERERSAPPSQGPVDWRFHGCAPRAVNTKRAGPKNKSSPFIGVSQYKKTGKYEAHIWDAAGDGPDGKGRQLHLGAFPTADLAARAYDRVALVLRGCLADLNFPIESYDADPLLSRLRRMSSKKLIVAAVRATVNDTLVKAFDTKVTGGDTRVTTTATMVTATGTKDWQVTDSHLEQGQGSIPNLPSTIMANGRLYSDQQGQDFIDPITPAIKGEKHQQKQQQQLQQTWHASNTAKQSLQIVNSIPEQADDLRGEFWKPVATAPEATFAPAAVGALEQPNSVTPDVVKWPHGQRGRGRLGIGRGVTRGGCNKRGRGGAQRGGGGVGRGFRHRPFCPSSSSHSSISSSDSSDHEGRVAPRGKRVDSSRYSVYGDGQAGGQGDRVCGISGGRPSLQMTPKSWNGLQGQVTDGSSLWHSKRLCPTSRIGHGGRGGDGGGLSMTDSQWEDLTSWIPREMVTNETGLNADGGNNQTSRLLSEGHTNWSLDWLSKEQGDVAKSTEGQTQPEQQQAAASTAALATDQSIKAEFAGWAPQFIPCNMYGEVNNSPTMLQWLSSGPRIVGEGEIMSLEGLTGTAVGLGDEQANGKEDPGNALMLLQQRCKRKISQQQSLPPSDGSETPLTVLLRSLDLPPIGSNSGSDSNHDLSGRKEFKNFCGYSPGSATPSHLQDSIFSYNTHPHHLSPISPSQNEILSYCLIERQQPSHMLPESGVPWSPLMGEPSHEAQIHLPLKERNGLQKRGESQRMDEIDKVHGDESDRSMDVLTSVKKIGVDMKSSKGCNPHHGMGLFSSGRQPLLFQAGENTSTLISGGGDTSIPVSSKWKDSQENGKVPKKNNGSSVQDCTLTLVDQEDILLGKCSDHLDPISSVLKMEEAVTAPESEYVNHQSAQLEKKQQPKRFLKEKAVKDVYNHTAAMGLPDWDKNAAWKALEQPDKLQPLNAASESILPLSYQVTAEQQLPNGSSFYADKESVRPPILGTAKVTLPQKRSHGSDPNARTLVHEPQSSPVMTGENPLATTTLEEEQNLEVQEEMDMIMRLMMA